MRESNIMNYEESSEAFGLIKNRIDFAVEECKKINYRELLIERNQTNF